MCCITAKLYVHSPAGALYITAIVYVHSPAGTLYITAIVYVHSPAGTLYITAIVYVHSPAGTLYITAIVYVHRPTGSSCHFANTIIPQTTMTVSTTYYNRLGNVAIMQLSGTIWYVKWKYIRYK